MRYATRHNKRDANESSLVLVAEQIGAGWIEAGPLDGWAIHRGTWVPVVGAPEAVAPTYWLAAVAPVAAAATTP